MLVIDNYVKIKKTNPVLAGGQDEIKLRPKNFKIDSSWNDIGIKASVSFYLRPFIYDNNILYFEEGDKKFEIWVGDEIEIFCKYKGYNSEYDNIVFKGYVSDFVSILSSLEVIIECEDEYFLFKNNTLQSDESLLIDESFNNLTLKEVINIAVDKVNKVNKTSIEAVVWDLNDVISFNIKKNITPAELLNLIKDRYQGLKIFFRKDEDDTKLYVGWSHWNNKGINDYSKQFDFAYIYTDGYMPLITFNLNLKNVNKNNVLVKITSTKNNKKIEGKFPRNLSEFGAKEVREINFDDETYTEEELKNTAESVWNDIGEDKGLTGKFITFGYPKIRHGDIITSTIFMNNDERIDRFFVKGVRTTLSQSGFRNELKLISY
jgi:hypothetical protein